jgi:ribosomal protein L12E/L44/L45/RPP1/RPP2
VSAVITFWLVITLGLALGYVVSYAISQQTMIYYILRKKVDGIEMNEVFEETEEELKPTALETAKPAESAPAAGAPKAEDKPASPPATEEKK